jgi:hypothetical protein
MRHALLSLLVVGTACSHAHGTGGPSTTSTPAPLVAPGPQPDPTNPGAGAAQPSTEQEIDARAPEARVALAPLLGIAINRPGVTPLAPPPVHKLPSLPTLPNLPAPASYPKLARPPSGENVAECGQVWSGSEWAPVECADPNVGGQPLHPATVVIPYDKMRPPIEQLPRMVDHRADGTEGPIRKQWGAQCTAFAFTSALDHAYARWTGTPGAFSVMQVWARYHTHAEHLAVNNNVGDLIGNESDWPYDGKVAGSYGRCKPNKPNQRTPGVDCAVLPDEAKLRYLDARAVAMITKVELVSTSELGVLREKLAAGQDATVQIKLPSFAVAGDPGSKYIVGIPATPPAKSSGAHQVLIAGYAMTPNGTYYLVHNSWGAKWADGGYAWLHEDFLKAFWADKLMVIPYVEPVDAASARADSRGGLSRACGGDQVPDSISGICAGKCLDGGPRHNDVCGSASDCPRGQVNLTGECLLAAPAGAGLDAQNGVQWACGAGGCTYSMPRGVLNCAEEQCAVSCPAPDFRLATTPRGFGCVD